MKLWPFFTFFGGKWRAAPHYPAPLYDTIIEPFAGSAGYSVRYPHYNIILVEKDPAIAAVWRFLIASNPSEILNLPLIRPDQSVDDLKTCYEARLLIGFWLNKGTVSPCKKPSAWMRAGIRPKSFWGPEIRARLATQVDAISHWRLVEGDYSLAPNVTATWFIDPPYFLTGHNYKMSNVAYSALSEWCQNRKGQIIVCETEGASWLPFQPFARIKTTEGHHIRNFNCEAIWYREEI